ncbi:MAG: UDP-3-O-(3-hydroxymyristoyl)glucosamine N-acyltransferase [Thermoguttaceae bacterium]|nr:UDP-3-O-(3-hydroxymyristoyl)glucosamine N-acyltransferase [Thermoguttaceae bacterium]MBQ2682273.1 UDP-3-O-(3-hydroxymyristoyl)glucosamine N-acyltransferase [Thermoguttaceae bacterium]MBQ6619198.1 UDP-3-O-(3-hydroxymyristoyl)glucosamine N-acyltransferase [Thermoguttaceae bacterium]
MKEQTTLARLSELLGGQVIGDRALIITGVAPLHLAKEGELTFLLDARYLPSLKDCAASAVMIPAGLQDRSPESFAGKSLLIVDQVSDCFDRAAALFRPPRTEMVRGISPKAYLDPTAVVEEGAAIGAGAYVGREVKIAKGCVLYPNTVVLDGTTVGEGTVLYPNVTIYENCEIGARCIIHASAAIGAYGFGYESSAHGHRLSAQLGNVVIGDDVEIGACSTVDRATHGSTVIGAGTKIDNLVMIAHNCRIGRCNLICAHTGVAGSTTTGDFVVMAGRVGVKDHVRIGTGAVLGAMAGVMGDIPEGSQYVGIPATDFKTQFKQQAAITKLPTMRREFIALQNEVRELRQRLDAAGQGPKE